MIETPASVLEGWAEGTGRLRYQAQLTRMSDKDLRAEHQKQIGIALVPEHYVDRGLDGYKTYSKWSDKDLQDYVGGFAQLKRDLALAHWRERCAQRQLLQHRSADVAEPAKPNWAVLAAGVLGVLAIVGVGAYFAQTRFRIFG